MEQNLITRDNILKYYLFSTVCCGQGKMLAIYYDTRSKIGF